MKKQLRSMMLAGAATLLAAPAWAQISDVAEGFKFQLDWEQPVSTATLPQAESRFGAANPVTGEILVTNKATKQIYAITKDGISVKYDISGVETTGALATGIACDYAGNVLFNSGWAGAGQNTNWYVIPAESGVAGVQPLNLVISDGEAGRVDCVGRVLGDVMSDEGGILLTAPNGIKATYTFVIKNGEMDESMTSIEYPDGFTTGSVGIAQPWGQTVEEQLSVSDASSAVFVYAYGNGSFVKPDVETGEFSLEARTGWVGGKSAYGFDVFVLNDEEYVVTGHATSAAYEDCFNIFRVSDGQLIATYTGNGGINSGFYQSLAAYPSADGKSVDIYEYRVATAARKFTLSLGGEEPQADPLYAVGAWCGWDPSSPDEFAYADGKYTITLGSEDAMVAEFKMSTTKGTSASDWTGFEAGVICVADDQVIDENGKEYPLAIGGNANITFGWSSIWTVTVDLTTNTISAVAATEKPVLDEGAPLYIVGANGTFNAADPNEFTYDATTKTYSYELVDPKYGFKISTAKGSWDDFNAGGFHINGSLAANTVTELLSGSPANGANITLAVAGDYTLVVDLNNMTIEAKTSTAVVVPESLYVIGNLSVSNNDWSPSVGVQLTKEGNKYVGNVELSGGYFSFVETLTGNWDTLVRYGATVKDQETHYNTPVAFQSGDNAFNFWDGSEYPLTVYMSLDFENHTLTVSTPSGVEAIAADAAEAAEYYNLQGLRVAQPEAGQLYIVKKGDKVSKVLVK